MVDTPVKKSILRYLRMGLHYLVIPLLYLINAMIMGLEYLEKLLSRV